MVDKVAELRPSIVVIVNAILTPVIVPNTKNDYLAYDSSGWPASLVNTEISIASQSCNLSRIQFQAGLTHGGVDRVPGRNGGALGFIGTASALIVYELCGRIERAGIDEKRRERDPMRRE